MKTRLNKIAGRRAFRAGVLIATTLLLLAALPVTAQTSTPYTAAGWVIGVPVPGIWFTNALGQVGFRGNAHLARVESTEARLPGRRTIFVDGAAQADGSAIIYGTAYQEVGTWDATGTNFTPTGGMWETTWRGTMGADGNLQLHIVGTGWGGGIDGLRLDETLTRAAGAILDPAIPYQYTGTIKPPPLNTTEIVDNFDDNLFTGDVLGSGTVVENNQQLNVTGSFPSPTTTLWESYCWGVLSPTWTVPNGMTREWRADLASLDENDTNPVVASLAVGTTSEGAYVFHAGRNFAYLWKWVPGPNVLAVLAGDRTTVRNTDVVLALALTRVQPNLVITARVLDKADPNTVLYQRTVVDTPNADPTLPADQFQALTGWRLVNLVPEAARPPVTQFGVSLGVVQYTDGQQPAPKAIFDNLEVRTSEIPPIGIERAVRLSWPASATINYAVEGAPTVQGPWLPVNELQLPGIQQVTVPASQPAQFFRLRQAP